MSRITGREVYELMEAYQSIYVSEEEVIVEDTEQLDEAPYDASAVRAAQEADARRQATAKMKGIQQNADLQKSDVRQSAAAPAGSSPKKMQQAAVQGMLDRQKIRTGSTNGWNKDNLTRTLNPKYTPQNIAKAQQAVGIKPAIPVKNEPQVAKIKPTSIQRPTQPPVAKTAPTPAGQTGDKAKDMATWAKANPGLAAAAAEKARIRGTQQTDNPLMKDMRSRLPMNSPSVQSPDVAKLGKGNQSLVNNPNAFKAATIAAAPSTSPSASGSVAPATAKIASATTQPLVAPAKKPLTQSYEYDAYDLVLEYLLDNGHADTVDEAHYVMLEMDSETISSIAEGSYEDKIAANNKKYDANRKRAAQRAQARNDARAQGKTGNVPGVGYVSPRAERTTYTDSSGTERHHSGARMPKKD